jgi:predicted RNase H-like nuclease
VRHDHLALRDGLLDAGRLHAYNLFAVHLNANQMRQFKQLHLGINQFIQLRPKSVVCDKQIIPRKKSKYSSVAIQIRIM